MSSNWKMSVITRYNCGWCNCKCARLEFGRSGVRTPVRSNQRLKLLFAASPRSTQY